MEKNQLPKKDKREMQLQNEQFQAKVKNVAWVAVIAAFFGGIIWLSMSGSGSGLTQEPAIPSELLTVTSDDYAVGLATAPVTLIEYLDFECEACGAYYPIIKELESAYSDDIRIVSRYFPLPGHKNSMTAALAVEAASRQGKYREMFDMAFKRQKDWGEKSSPTPEVFEGYAEELGLNVDQFKKDVASESVKNRVRRDFDAGEKLGNSGTPTFFLNGKKISNPNGLTAFKELIDRAIAEGKTQ